MALTDDRATLGDLKGSVRRFTSERDWERFHRPKDLGLCLAIEVGEVLEHFRFRADDQVDELLRDPDRKRALSHELADSLWALLRLADVCEVDLSASLEEKLALAAEKYPIDQSSGRAEKYTAYSEDSSTRRRPSSGDERFS